MGKKDKKKDKREEREGLDDGSIMCSEAAGFEFSKPYPLCRDAIFLLEHLSRGKRCVYWQIDDGPHPEVEQLRQLAKEEGHFEYVFLDEHRHMIVDTDACEVRLHEIVL